MKHRSILSVLGLFVLLVFSLTLGATGRGLIVTGLKGEQTDLTGIPQQPQGNPIIFLPVITNNEIRLSILLGQSNVEQGLFLDYGGDVDTEIAPPGYPASGARRTGNGVALPSEDGNLVPDYYMQFRADDSSIFAGVPTTRLRLEIEYFDEGTDTFSVAYDAAESSSGDGRFTSAGVVIKTNTMQFKTAAFELCDAYFANRDNGADFRIEDRGDGAETIRHLTVTLLSVEPVTINVDTCGANPWDTSPDSEAIQTCIAQAACPGDTVAFTSGVNSSGYQGYRIDKTVFLVKGSARHGLTFTSTDTNNPALLQATTDLKGFVVRLAARSQVFNLGNIDDITVANLNLDGSRSVRLCYGSDGIENGLDDNWGSWLPECSTPGDAWCRAGTLAMDGEYDASDVTQNYAGNPSYWSTGLRVENVNIYNTECGTGLSMGAAASTIQNSVVTTAGDHVHRTGCVQTDPDEGRGAWSDGLTLLGPGLVISNNLVTDASDVGIVFFGGKGTVITHNTIQASAGNHGMFAAIAIHPWTFGDVSGVQVINNWVNNLGSSTCGGIHAGINLGPHMWGNGCVSDPAPGSVGNSNQCLAEPAPPSGTLCTPGNPCQVWAYVAGASTLTLENNTVAGAQVNYLIEGVDLVGSFILSGNTSNIPRMTDWEAAQNGCTTGSFTDTWNTIDWAAHHPSLEGWLDQRIHCER